MGTVLLKAFAIWILFALLAGLNGVVREKFFIPFLGERLAPPLSGVLLSILIFLVTYFTLPFLGISGRSSWMIGAMWLSLTVLFEFGFGHYMMGKSWGELTEAYKPHKGNQWLLVLVTIFIAPYLASRLKGLIQWCR